MKATDHINPKVKYSQYDWGDLIQGSKEQLQALGIGVGQLFPGDAGGPKRSMHTVDPRGYPVKVSRYSYEEEFSARVYFPGWPEPPTVLTWTPTEFAGVQRREVDRRPRGLR